MDNVPPICFNDTDKSVSRKHARLSFNEGNYGVKCISTINPTSLRVNYIIEIFFFLIIYYLYICSWTIVNFRYLRSVGWKWEGIIMQYRLI